MDVRTETYSCAAGETFDLVARKLFGSERYAAELLCVNPETCRKAMFSGGEKLRIPVISLPEEDGNGMPLAAPWRTEE